MAAVKNPKSIRLTPASRLLFFPNISRATSGNTTPHAVPFGKACLMRQIFNIC